uniref:Uncharacterized protein n=1 Tax=Clastoptera arizonana TaxID=38151 RepID=A0A1B6D8M2_9HEMI
MQACKFIITCCTKLYIIYVSVDKFGIRSNGFRDEYTLMNTEVRAALGITSDSVYDSQAGYVFDFLWLDFMKPVTDIVARLLNETNLSVVVYSGQLDLIVDTPGTLTWVEKLDWPLIHNWTMAERNPLLVNNIVEGFTKKFNNFAFYWINRAGHMSPSDNPEAVIQMLKEVTNLK